MFKKKKCKRCGKNASDKYDFCPHCGNNLTNNSQEDFGLLGKTDSFFPENEIQLPFGLNKMFNSLMKNLTQELNKELQKEQNPKQNKANARGVSIRISTAGNQPPMIEIDSFGNPQRNNQPQEKKVQKVMPQKVLSNENLKKISGLPKKEPKTNLTRLSDKIIYEIDIPGVKSLDDVSIIKLENSIEIKALTKDKVYAKLIPISLPITNYLLEKGKLVLELGEK
jgi:HSP20 family molecular chaperone IbpA